MINKLIMDTLKPLNLPVANLRYASAASTYITFFTYNEQGEAWAEDKEITTGFYMQVDVWSTVDFTSLVEQVKSLLGNVGFSRTYVTELFEPDTKLYHKVLRFVYYGRD